MLLASLLLAGCAALPQPEITPVRELSPDNFPFAYYQQASPADVFKVVAASLTLKTYRAGWLKSLAHAHVMTTDTLTGFVHVDPQGEGSRADLYFRPYDLILDDPEIRAAAGPEFASKRSQGDIVATRQRMLGPRQLDSNGHPFIKILVLPGQTAEEVVLEIAVRGHAARKVVPVTWHLDGGELSVNSEFQLQHRELGLRPYSAFAGALAVAEGIDVLLKLTASRVDLTTSNIN